jgi:hypothetical protein
MATFKKKNKRIRGNELLFKKWQFLFQIDSHLSFQEKCALVSIYWVHSICLNACHSDSYGIQKKIVKHASLSSPE